MSEHEWKFVENDPVKDEYWFKCTNCGLKDHVPREAFIEGLKPDPPNKLCLGKIEEAKEETPQVPKCDSNLDTGISFDDFVDALYRAGWRSVCDAQHTEIEKTVEKVMVTELDIDDVAATSPKAKKKLAALRAENARLRKQMHDDTSRLLYSYSVHQTTSEALIKVELRLLSGQSLSLEEIRMAIDDAMNNDPDWP